MDAGLTVRLIDKQGASGGRARSTADSDGYLLNQGPHALYLSGELRATLKGLGIDPLGAPPNLKGALGTIGTITDLLPQGPVTMFKTSLLPAKGKLQLAALMARLPGMKSAGLGSTSVETWLTELTDVPELRTLIRGLVTLATYNPGADLASADAAIEQMKLCLLYTSPSPRDS